MALPLTTNTNLRLGSFLPVVSFLDLGRMRRMKQQQEFKKAREALLEKVAARSFAKNYLSSLKSDVSTHLRPRNYSVALFLNRTYNRLVWLCRHIRGTGRKTHNMEKLPRLPRVQEDSTGAWLSCFLGCRASCRRPVCLFTCLTSRSALEALG